MDTDNRAIQAKFVIVDTTQLVKSMQQELSNLGVDKDITEDFLKELFTQVFEEIAEPDKSLFEKMRSIPNFQLLPRADTFTSAQCSTLKKISEALFVYCLEESIQNGINPRENISYVFDRFIGKDVMLLRLYG